mmetsp:Transcript_3513/g.7605  ORF Transcript_3513/g.7605 Transcript_3513/m.7605 type:complete len:138 (-) Transcript_3513:403-816(-)
MRLTSTANWAPPPTPHSRTDLLTYSFTLFLTQLTHANLMTHSCIHLVAQLDGAPGADPSADGAIACCPPAAVAAVACPKWCWCWYPTVSPPACRSQYESHSGSPPSGSCLAASSNPATKRSIICARSLVALTLRPTR